MVNITVADPQDARTLGLPRTATFTLNIFTNKKEEKRERKGSSNVTTKHQKIKVEIQIQNPCRRIGDLRNCTIGTKLELRTSNSKRSA